MNCDPETVAPIIYQTLFYWSLFGLLLVSLYAWMLSAELKWTKEDKGWFPEVKENTRKKSTKVTYSGGKLPRTRREKDTTSIAIKEPSDEAQLRM